MTSKTLSPWMVRTSTVAIGVALVAFGAASPVKPQSFQGTPSTVAGQIDSITTGTGTTDVLINSASPQAVIDWTPTDNGPGPGVIAFQPGGTTATFSRFGGGDFAVLNRILPADVTRQVRLDGAIQGLVGASTQTTGGTVFIYSPGGIILGPNAQIDVGALGLTTSSPQITTGPSGGFITSVNGAQTVTYTGATQGTTVEIQPGAQINAPVDKSSYVAVFAPVIRQDGTINVNGSTALVAGAAGTLTWHDGLFDIQTTVGTDSDTAVTHSGTTGGTVGSGVNDGTDYHRVYIVAVPRNNAITSLISEGSVLGFDVATAVDVVGNAVILSTGEDIASGGSVIDGFTASAAAGTGTADIELRDTNINSRLHMRTLNGAPLLQTFIGSTGAASDVLMEGSPRVGNDVEILIRPSTTFNIGGNLTMRGLTRYDAVNNVVQVGDGNGLVRLNISGGSLSVGGDLTMDVSGFVQSPFINAGARGVGGRALIGIQSGGDVIITGDVVMNGNALGGLGADAQGGLLQLSVLGAGSTLDVSGDFSAGASASGGADSVNGDGGGDGIGGSILVSVGGGAGSAMTVDGDTSLAVVGFGGGADDTGSGEGRGGTASITADTGALVNLNALDIDASGFAGAVTGASVAGAGTGGNALLDVVGFDATVTVAGTLSFRAQAGTSSTFSGATGTGGLSGGSASIIGNGTLAVNGTASLDASAMALSQNGTVYGYDVTGGNATVTVSGAGQMSFLSDLTVAAQGIGSAGAATGLAAGAAIGGNASVSARDSARIVSGASVTVDASAFGGNGIGVGADGGVATGGNALASVADGTSLLFVQSDLNLYAEGRGGLAGAGGRGGDGTGSTAIIQASGAGFVSVGGVTLVSAKGAGGNGPQPASSGGAGIAGSAQISQFEDGNLNFARFVIVSADGAGGSATGGGSDPVTAGTGQGGNASITANGTGVINLVRGMSVTATGAGGAADGNGGVANGGNAQGGSALVSADGSSAIRRDFDPDFGSDAMAIDARATGGSAVVSGSGGSAQGGSARLAAADIGASVVLVLQGANLTVAADAAGGLGAGAGDGGAAIGGDATIESAGSASVSGTSFVTAEARGGNAVNGNAGAATGGIARVGVFAQDTGSGPLDGGTLDLTSTLVALSMSANAYGGSSVLGGGGDARSGVVVLQAIGGTDTTGGFSIAGDVGLQSFASGGDGTTGGDATSLSLSGDRGGNAVLTNIGSIFTLNRDLSIDVSARGGDSSAPGAAGGDAIGGVVRITAFSGVSSDVGMSLEDVRIFADALGGFGAGPGAPSATPLAGGVGGSATGGGLFVSVVQVIDDSFTTAPLLSAGLIDLNAAAIGGDGGAGEANTAISGNGAAGGAGGAATGGVAKFRAFYDGLDVGTGFGPAGIDLVGIVADLGAEGGRGGNGGAGGPGLPGNPSANPPIPPTPAGFAGNGGTGGTATTARADINASYQPFDTALSDVAAVGSPFIVSNSVLIDKTATGGDGGNGSFSFGGDATVGSVSIEIRSGDGTVQDQRGLLNVGDFIVTGAALGGTSPNTFGGGSMFADGPVIDMRFGDLIANEFTIDSFASFGASYASPGRIDIVGANITVFNSFSLLTRNEFSVSSNNSLFSANNLFLNVGNFIPAGASGALSDFGALEANVVSISSDQNIQIGGILSAQSFLSLTAQGQVLTGDLSSGGQLFVSAGGSVSAGNVQTPGEANILSFFDGITFANANVGNLQLTSSSGITAGDIVSSGDVVALANNPIYLGTTGTAPSVFGDISAQGFVELESLGGDITTGAVRSGSDFDVTAAGSIATGAIDVGDAITFISGGDIVTGAILAGHNPTGPNFDGESSIGLVAEGSVTTGDITAPDALGIGANSGGITTGNITAPGGVLLLARTGVSAGNLNAGNSFAYVADSSMFPLGGTVDDFDPNPILQSQPTPLAGPVNLGSQVTANVLVAATSGSITAGNVNASVAIRMLAGQGAVNVNGIWASPDIAIASSDIVIAPAGRLNAGVNGTIGLLGLNAGGMRIGDTASGGGYILDRAEFSRINSGDLFVGAADTDRAVDMTIGDLDITGPLAGSTIDRPDGAVIFYTRNISAVGNPNVNVTSGGIRVTGAVRARGFNLANELAFETDLLEVDATTGSIEILGNGTTLSGSLRVDARAFRAAHPDILAKLAQNPLYAERTADLNTPLGNRLNGIVRAEGFDLGPDVEAFLIQNTGTAQAPAGFATNAEGVIEFDFPPDPGTFDLIINGVIIEPPVSGTALRDFLVDDSNRALFTAGSSINGCVLGAAECAEAAPVLTEDVLQADNLSVIDLDPLAPEPAPGQEEPLTEEEREEQEQASEAAKRAPIAPPAPLINTAPLNPEVDVDEPISGSGNPALIGGGGL